MTLVSQYDVELLLAIETHMGSKLEPLEPEEAQVLEMLHDVASARRVALLELTQLWRLAKAGRPDPATQTRDADEAGDAVDGR